MTFNRRTVMGGMIAAGMVPAAQSQAEKNSTGAFPKGFLWGAATSSYQVEGNNIAADTWVLEHVKPTLYSQPSGDAANSFALWRQDLDIVKRLGLNTYRFSLEWSRIEPEPGEFSIAALDHYKAMIEGCRNRGLIPFVTFNHFTVPRWFAARGAWTDEASVGLFERYCDRAARHLASGIGYATTLNEPNLGAVVRNALGRVQMERIAPLLAAMQAAAAKSIGSTRFVSGNTISVPDEAAMTRNMIAAHRAGRAAIKAVRADLPVGTSLALPDDQAAGPGSIRDSIRATQNDAWLDAVRSDDFLGVQNYERNVWDENGKVTLPKTGELNATGTPIFADSIANVVRYAHARTRLPIFVTEHGVSADDDAVRSRFTRAAIGELNKVVKEGIPLKGYIHWSLLDNYEWIYGYKHKYGLVSVDRTTFKRTLKPSAAMLGSIARANGV